jgi:hypothetical protein
VIVVAVVGSAVASRCSLSRNDAESSLELMCSICRIPLVTSTTTTSTSILVVVVRPISVSRLVKIGALLFSFCILHSAEFTSIKLIKLDFHRYLLYHSTAEEACLCTNIL